MPIYSKSDNLYDYLEWMNEFLNNNKVSVYENQKFTKRKSIFDAREPCKESVIYEQTNPKYKKFTQLFYHAGSFQDLERYGYIYIRCCFGQNNDKKLILKNDTNKTNIYDENPVSIWDKFNVTFKTIKQTMKYMMNKMKKGILIGIKNNKLLIFLPFSKHDYKNDFYNELYFILNYS